VSAVAPPAGAPRSAPARAASPSWRIVAGLLAGVAVGLFFGEDAALLQPVADLYIRAMQMTVLPYLVLTLIGGLGQFDPATARRLGLRAVALLGLLLALSCAVIALMPLAFPSLVSASFYSDALVEPAQSFALGELYVPANPFYAMANAIVPGLVLFSSALGLALIGVPDKAPLLAVLRAMELAVVRVTQFVLRLTPYGVFAITAAVAGTISPESLARLQVYFIVFGAAALLLAFVILPLAVAALTPFGWRQVVGLCHEALITAFVANTAFIVLPMLVERIKAALTAQAMDSTDTRSAVDVVVPIAFVVPNAGKLLTLLFVPFAAWLAGDPLAADAYATLFGAGVPSYFAKAQVALPFLMDLLGVPHDLFQLYIPSSIITGKFDSMVTVMSLLALALLTAAAVSGRLQWQWRRIAPALGLGLAAMALTVVGLKLGLAFAVDTSYHKDEVLKAMHLPREALPIALLSEPPMPDAVKVPALQRIRARGVLRVAFVGDRVPFAFVNARGDLVGMEVELAQRLALDLGAKRVDFVPADFRQMARLLAEGRIDVAMGMPYLSELLPEVAYSLPYLDSTLGLVVRDELREDFAAVERLARRSPVTIALLADLPGLKERLQSQLKGVELRFVTLASPKDFFEGRAPRVDAFAMLAEAGAAWAILYPAFSAVVPQPGPIAMPVGVGLHRGDVELAGVVNDWLVIQRSAGVLAQARDYWVLGRGAQEKKPRWSIRRDVLGWGLSPDDAATAGRPVR
jgi:Na+/H+-dicarboxylate symporter/ABC-type amino acid transport substrate-binding protein